MKETAVIESILFAAGEPVPLGELAAALSVSKPHLVQLLEKVADGYAMRGIRLIFDGRTAQLVTAPETAAEVARFQRAELRGSLSPGALETLAIVAYQGPVTRPQIDTIRGVQSTAPLRTLAIRGLIREVGRASEPGKPYRYDVTLELYKHLGISGRRDLPQAPAELVDKLAKSSTPS